MVTETGFLLSYIKYGDHDAVIHAFTETQGYRSYFVRGIYSKNSRKKPFLFPLRELQINSNTAKNNGLPNVSRLELAETRDFESNVKAGAVLFFTADLLNQILRNESSSSAVYAELSRFLDELQSGNYTSHLVFMIRMLLFSGIGPLTGEGKFLDPEKGNFVFSQSHQLFDEEISESFKNILSIANPYELKIPVSLRHLLLDAVLLYYAFHVPDFRIPKSLEIVQQIFS